MVLGWRVVASGYPPAPKSEDGMTKTREFVFMGKPISYWLALNAHAEQMDYAKLIEKIAELEAAQRWISVSEQLPKEMQEVLVSVGVKLSIMYHSRVGWTDEWFIDNDVTHWMPLPQLPKPEGAK